jgi:Protein kinase domain
MTGISDAALRHLREIADLPDLDGTPYEILETLGRGGMGTVYLALDHRLDREVALKTVQLPAGSGEEIERLLREARVLARLEHPGIVPIHDAGLLPDGRAFYAMKRVRGLRLDEHARAVPLPDRLRAFERVCETVAFAHARHPSRSQAGERDGGPFRRGAGAGLGGGEGGVGGAVQGPHPIGNSTVNTDPLGTLSSTRIAPWWSATMRWTIARPRPVPRPLVEK